MTIVGARRPTPVIVVAVSDAEPRPSSVDLQFAAAEALTRGASLRLVHGCATRSASGVLGLDVTQVRVHYGQHVLEAAAQILRRLTGDGVAVATVNARALGIDALLAESADADLVVVLRRRDPVGQLGAGSTVGAVAGRARCPVVVLRAGALGASIPAGVVVGLDDGDRGPALVRAAAAEAWRRGVPLTVVHAWQPGGATAAPTGYAPIDATDRETEEDLSSHRLADATRGLGAAFPDLELVARSVHGSAVEVLIDFSHLSELLVVGGPASPVAGLGRTARALVEQARCPVMVWPTGALGSLASGVGVSPARPGRRPVRTAAVRP